MVDLVLGVEADAAHAAGPAVGLGAPGGPLAVGRGLPADQVVPAVVLVIRPSAAAAAAAAAAASSDIVLSETASVSIVVVGPLIPLTSVAVA